jgi:hypothetical protein
MKPLSTLLAEAFVVGIILALFYVGLSRFFKPLQAVFLSGALFHLVCEFTGVNAWYAKKYFI